MARLALIIFRALQVLTSLVACIAVGLAGSGSVSMLTWFGGQSASHVKGGLILGLPGGSLIFTTFACLLSLLSSLTWLLPANSTGTRPEAPRCKRSRPVAVSHILIFCSTVMLAAAMLGLMFYPRLVRSVNISLLEEADLDGLQLPRDSLPPQFQAMQWEDLPAPQQDALIRSAAIKGSQVSLIGLFESGNTVDRFNVKCHAADVFVYKCHLVLDIAAAVAVVQIVLLLVAPAVYSASCGMLPSVQPRRD